MNRFCKVVSVSVLLSVSVALFSGCNGSEAARSNREYVIIKEKTPLRLSTINKGTLKVGDIYHVSYAVSLYGVTIAEPDPTQDGTYFKVEGHKEWTGWGAIFHDEIDKITIFPRTPEQKQAWEEKIHAELKPRDVLPE